MRQFRYISHIQEIIFGLDSISKLADYLRPFGWRRLMLCTSGTSLRNGHVASVGAALGDRLVATFGPVHPHVPDDQMSEALAVATERAVDAVIGLGGGSPIGMAKAVAFRLGEERAGRVAHAAHPVDPAPVPTVAIPTTYAGSEMTPVFGVTHTSESPPRKVTVSDPKIAPRLVIYDPRLTLDLPPELTASTGINALAHCVEALYSVTRNPVSSAAAVEGIRYIARALPRCYAQSDDLQARTEALLGAHLAGAALASVSMALHHGLCHVLGGTAGVPHGVANAIVLPHAIRFNLDATAELLAPAAEAMGIDRDGRDEAALVEAAAQFIQELVGRLRLPQRLRDVGVNEAELPRLAQLVFQNRSVQNNPKPIEAPAAIEALLREMW